jgi:hypothetical protein
MMAAISPADDNFEETTGTLLFAKSVKMIKTTPAVNVSGKKAAASKPKQSLDNIY